jgi:predicted Abi (CAAX) family protease
LSLLESCIIDTLLAGFSFTLPSCIKRPFCEIIFVTNFSIITKLQQREITAKLREWDDTFAKYFAGFSAQRKIVKRAYSKLPDVSLFTA